MSMCLWTFTPAACRRNGTWGKVRKGEGQTLRDLLLADLSHISSLSTALQEVYPEHIFLLRFPHALRASRA